MKRVVFFSFLGVGLVATWLYELSRTTPVESPNRERTPARFEDFKARAEVSSQINQQLGAAKDVKLALEQYLKQNIRDPLRVLTALARPEIEKEHLFAAFKQGSGEVRRRILSHRRADREFKMQIRRMYPNDKLVAQLTQRNP